MHVREISDYPELDYLLSIIGVSEKPHIIGSFVYKDHKYPSDIDVNDKYIYQGSHEDALDFYCSFFQTMARQLLHLKDEFFMTDFKIGEDKAIISDEDCMFKNGLITSDEYKSLLHLRRTDLDGHKDKIEKLTPLRWSLEEVVCGEKNIRGNHIMCLRDAIAMDAMIKIDVVGWGGKRYISVELMYDLGDRAVGMYRTPESIVLRLKQGIKKLFSAKYYNPLKGAKRLWTYSTIVGNDKLSRKLLPLFSQDAAALNQVLGDLEMIINVINKYGVVNDKMFVQIYGLKKQAFNHMSTQQYKRLAEMIHGHLCKCTEQCVLDLHHDIEGFIKPLITEEADAFIARNILRGSRQVYNM